MSAAKDLLFNYQHVIEELTLVTGSKDNTVKLWDLADLK